MSITVYILWSSTLQRHYVGFSADGERRIRQHRSGHKCWTVRAADWVKVWEQAVPDRLQARALEKRIKARGARRFLQDQNAQVHQHLDREKGE